MNEQFVRGLHSIVITMRYGLPVSSYLKFIVTRINLKVRKVYNSDVRNDKLIVPIIVRMY